MINIKSKKSLYSKVIAKKVYLLILMISFLILIVGYSITLGAANISLIDSYGIIIQEITSLNIFDYSPVLKGIILEIRLPRVLLAVIAGISLGSSGSVMQSVLRNSLATLIH